MLKKIFLVLLTLFVPFSLLFAEDSVVKAEQVVITATRTETEILDVPGHVTVITEEDIKKMGAKNISDILTRQAGIKINNYGAAGAQKSISMRGSSSAQVLILINGVRLNDSRQGGADLATIPLDNIEKIEVVRGGTSALYGADAVGGIINIITKKEAENKLTIKVENGSYIPQKSVKVSEGPVEEDVDAQIADIFDTQKVSVQYSRKINDLNIVTAGSFTRANNEFVWNDTEFINDKRKRINADLLGGDLYAGVSFPLRTGQFDITGIFAYNNVGTPGEIDPKLDPFMGYVFSTDARQQNTSFNGIIHYYTGDFFSEVLSFDTKVFYKYSKLDFEDPPGPKSSHTLNTAGLDIVQELSSFDLFSLIYGGNFLYDTVESTEIEKQDRISVGLFLEAPLYLLPQLTITPVVRYDSYSNFPNSLNFKLSGVYNLSNETSIKASVSKSYRAPTFNDLFWPEDAWSKGNPDLVPETGYSCEAGLSTIKDRFQFDIYAFTRYMIDNIEWAETSPFFYEPSNIGTSLYPGAEINVSFNFFNHFRVTADYTFIYSFVLDGTYGDYKISDDKRIKNVAVNSFDAGIEYKDPKNLARLGAEFMGKRYADEANTNELESYILLNTLYQRKISDVFTMFVSVDNILNNAYEVLDKYIMPPFFLRTGIEASF